MNSKTTDRLQPAYPLSQAQIDQLKALDARIPDTKDIPPAPDANWAAAVRGKHHAAAQQTVSIRLDPDVQLWLARKGSGYEASINQILREKMLSEA